MCYLTTAEPELIETADQRQIGREGRRPGYAALFRKVSVGASVLGETPTPIMVSDVLSQQPQPSALAKPSTQSHPA